MAPGMIMQLSLYDELRTKLPSLPASCIAGAVDITLKAPFERIKIRMQQSSCDVLAGVGKEIRSSGVLSLWSGYKAALVRDIPYTVIKWTTYDMLQRATAHNCEMGGQGMQHFCNGLCAGALAALVVTPADVLKTRLQLAQHIQGAEGLFLIIRNIIRTEGVAALFTGLNARMLRIPIYTGITLSTFGAVKRSLELRK